MSSRLCLNRSLAFRSSSSSSTPPSYYLFKSGSQGSVVVLTGSMSFPRAPGFLLNCKVTDVLSSVTGVLPQRASTVPPLSSCPQSSALARVPLSLAWRSS